jgi:membrane-associated HD superfamily phosphohydrolase
MAIKRLQDGQFDQCELTLRELSRIEDSLSKSLTAHHHGRIAYPKPAEQNQQTVENEKKNA